MNAALALRLDAAGVKISGPGHEESHSHLARRIAMSNSSSARRRTSR
jgi:hypothetical protein